MILFMNGLAEVLFLGLHNLITPERLWAAAAGNEPGELTSFPTLNVLFRLDRCYG